jgi:hypothetical protein
VIDHGAEFMTRDLRRQAAHRRFDVAAS